VLWQHVFQAVVCVLSAVRRGPHSTQYTLSSQTSMPPVGAWMFVCCECCVLLGRGLCDRLITRPEVSYLVWRVVVCDQETSKNEEAKARYRAVEKTTAMCCNAKKTNKHITFIMTNITAQHSLHTPQPETHVSTTPQHL
jgi:hypothetical protein